MSAARGADGRVMFFWCNGAAECFAQAISATGEAGPAERVFGDELAAVSKQGAVAWAGDGSAYVAIGAKLKDGKNTILFQRLDGTGKPAGDPSRIDDTLESLQGVSARVVPDVRGGSWILWAAPQKGKTSQLFYRRINGAGTSSKPVMRFAETRLLDDGDLDAMTLPHGGILVVSPGPVEGLELRIVSQIGELAPVLFVHDRDSARVSKPSLAVGTSGETLVAWEARGKDKKPPAIHTTFMQLTGATTPVVTLKASEASALFVAAQREEYAVAWQEASRVMIQRFTSSGVPMGEPQAIASPAGARLVAVDHGTGRHDFVVLTSESPEKAVVSHVVEGLARR